MCGSAAHRSALWTEARHVAMFRSDIVLQASILLLFFKLVIELILLLEVLSAPEKLLFYSDIYIYTQCINIHV